jgi:hypothetical protein
MDDSIITIIISVNEWQRLNVNDVKFSGQLEFCNWALAGITITRGEGMEKVKSKEEVVGE